MTLQSNRLYLDSTRLDRIMARVARQTKVGEMWAVGTGPVIGSGTPIPTYLPITYYYGENAYLELDGSGYIIDQNGNGIPDLRTGVDSLFNIVAGDGILGFAGSLGFGETHYGVYDYLPIISYRRLSQVEQSGAFTDIAGFSYEIKVPISHFINQWPNYLRSGEVYQTPFFGGFITLGNTSRVTAVQGGVDNTNPANPITYYSPQLATPSSDPTKASLVTGIIDGMAPRILIKLDEFGTIGALPGWYKYRNTLTGAIRLSEGETINGTNLEPVGTTNLLNYQVGPDGVVTMVIEDWIPTTGYGSYNPTDPFPDRLNPWVSDITQWCGPIPAIDWNPATDLGTHKVITGCYSTRNYFRDPYYSLRKVAL